MGIKKEINSILEQHSIQEVEAALIQFYLEQHNILQTKNDLLNNCLRNNKDKSLVKKISEIIPSNDLKSLERIFELLIEPLDRQLNGAFYTPEYIVKYIVNQTVLGDMIVCDPSCGSGAFLLEAVEKIHKDTGKSFISIIENNIYGCDILDYAIRRSKLLLTLLAVSHGEDQEQIKFNLICKDSLTTDWTNEFPKILASKDEEEFGIPTAGFDAIIGNPPYVRIQDFGLEKKKVLESKWKSCVTGNFNLYFAFFELGTKLIKKGGKLGYITPNNYFTSLAAEPLREFLQNNRLLSRILDFDHLQIFEDATTYTCITIIEKNRKTTFEYQILDNKDSLLKLDGEVFTKINFENLNNKKWRLLNEQDYNNIKKIESIGKPLKGLFDIHVGIATLKDVLFFIDASKVEGAYYIKEFKGQKFLIEKEITKPVRKISSFEGEEDIKKDQRRIIVPYLIKNNSVTIISEDELKKIYPKCYQYFLAIKEELEKRDKGKKEYVKWYAYGRSQGLNKFGKKLLTPTFSNKPRFMYDEDPESLFCNGYAIFEKSPRLSLIALKKILNSAIMDYFARKTSVDLEGGYQCYQKNFIQSFSIPQLSEAEIAFLETDNDEKKINEFLLKKYTLDEKVLNLH